MVPIIITSSKNAGASYSCRTPGVEDVVDSKGESANS